VYVKIFEDILDSSIWDESLATRIVWITLLIMADEEGVVRAATSGIRRRAGVSEKEVAEAVKVLSEPDLDSKDKDYGGRRIERVDGGYLVLNYRKYREIRTKKQQKDAERQRRHRAKERDMSRTSHHVTTNASASVSGSNGDPGVDEGGNGGEPPSEENVTVTLPVPTRKNPIVATNVAETLAQLAQVELSRDNLLTAQAYALFSYWCFKTKRRQGSTQFTVDRFNRLKLHIEQRGLSFCLYVCDGGVKHKHLNRDDGKNWELDSFFPYQNADRLEKLVAITRFDREPVHPLIKKHPELGGGDA